MQGIVDGKVTTVLKNNFAAAELFEGDPMAQVQLLPQPM
jgi:hypothetical protein